MAGARIENQIGALAGELVARPVRDPSVFADFVTQPHAAEIEDEIAERTALSADVSLDADTFGPGFEPAGLIMNAFAGQVLLADKAEDPGVGDKAGRIE